MSRATSLVVAICLALVGCSDDGASSDATAPASTVAATTELPIVEQISEAIAAVDAQFMGPQEYFEVNATAQLVNLFVALEGGTAVQAWLYLDGELTSDETAPAQGGTFRAANLDFDPATIFSALLVELPGVTVESFYIHGDGQGAVQYGALLTTSLGGALDVRLSSDGQILSSETLN
ncbi:MAG: hypothetical protein ABL953_06475 [Ilumatobacteraceae bacterium]